MEKLAMFASCLIVGLFAASSAFADYPAEVNKRPLTLPGAAWGVDAALDLTNKFEAASLSLTGKYAVNDTMQVNVGYSLPIKEFAVSKAVSLGISSSVMNDDPFRVAPSLTLPLIFEEGADGLGSVNIGLDGRYNLSGDQIAICCGHGLLEYYVLSSFYIINIPLEIGYQVDGKSNVRLDTTLATMAKGADLVSIADATPMTISVVYSMGSDMDVGANLGFDAQAAGDPFAAGDTLAYRAF